MSHSGTTQPPKSFVRGPLMNDPILNDLFTYWETLRAGRLAPLRSDIDPREIKSALDYTFILESTAAGHPRVRLAGSKVCDLLGMELRGMPIRSLMEPEHREDFDVIVDQTMAVPEVVELKLLGQIAGDQMIGARMLLLPLADSKSKVKRILGGVSLERTLPRPPIRFEIHDTRRTRIVAGETRTAFATVGGFAEEPRMFDRSETSALKTIQGSGRKLNSKPRSGHLRLVKDEE